MEFCKRSEAKKKFTKIHGIHFRSATVLESNDKLQSYPKRMAHSPNQVTKKSL